MKSTNIIQEIERNKEIIAACLVSGESVELAISRSGKLKAFRKRTYHLQLPGLPESKQEGGKDGK